MNNRTGANRPALKRKLKSIAVAAIVLILGLGAAAYAQYTGPYWFGMGPDGILGMMPPGGMYDGGGRRKAPPPCPVASPITIVQSEARHSFTYVSKKNGCVYTITRNGKTWLTATYDSSAKTYRLTDPAGTGALLLELGIPPGQFPTTRRVDVNPN